MNWTAIAALLLSLGEAHHEIGTLYTELAEEIAPLRPIDYDVLVLARAIQGEEAGHFGDQREELGVWIAHTAYNRWEKPWWKEIDGIPCTFAARVEYDWKGARLVKRPDPWAVRIAQQVLNERKAGGEDITGGALFAMTIHDLETNGWLTEQTNKIIVKIILESELARYEHTFVFMTNYPGEKE